MRSSALAMLTLMGCGAGDDGGESADVTAIACEQVRDHLVDLRMVDASRVDHAAHRDAMRAALGADFVARCQSSLTPHQISCVMYALDPQAAASCAGAIQ